MKLFDKKLGKYPCNHLVKMQMILNLQSLVRYNKELLNDVKTTREVFGEKVNIKWSQFFN